MYVLPKGLESIWVTARGKGWVFKTGRWGEALLTSLGMAMIMVSCSFFFVLRDTDAGWCRARIRTTHSISRASLGELCISLLVRIECSMSYVNIWS